MEKFSTSILREINLSHYKDLQLETSQTIALSQFTFINNPFYDAILSTILPLKTT